MRSLSCVSVRRISAAPGRNTSSEPCSARKPRCNGLHHLALNGRALIAPDIARLHRKGAALAFDHRRVAKQSRHARAVERRRHHQDFQILAQALLHIARQRQPEIGIERPFMEFVEQHGGNAIERGIVEHQPREHAFGHHLDAGALGNLGAEAHAQADRVADLLAKRRRHAAAAARAASRRGSSTRIFLSFAHGSSSSTSGTRVVLPAPGGATSTAA